MNILNNNLQLTVEEKLIILDFMTGMVLGGYEGDDELYDTNNINQRVFKILDKLGFTNAEISDFID